MAAFSSIAPFYDALADKAGRLEREGPVLRRVLDAAAGRRVLDLACGTGLHALFLAEAGAAVTAIDVSAAMIDYACRVRPHPKITYRVRDMRDAEGGPYDLALCLGNSLSLLADEDHLKAVFARLRLVLAPGGLFLAHVLNYAAAVAQEARHRVERAVVEDMPVVAVKNLVPDGAHTFLSLSFFFETREEAEEDLRSGTLSPRERVGVRVEDDGRDARAPWTGIAETAVLRNWSVEDLTRAARRYGLVARDIFGAFDGRSYEPETSPDLLVLFAAETR
ncbi:MAG TPA: class I SAM-dependent methyltransferase [Candidatus Hydrogenedentes bacterium]|nr:class I SAM-dependent methyltransferase [Candidatus Hydrogenedentota bacterium]HNT86791.1 class I SAM-dependent methyltransferase [Candidatus Hydrogenedentota bacterium]